MTDVTAAVAAATAAAIAAAAADCDNVDKAMATTCDDAMPMPIMAMLRFDDEPRGDESVCLQQQMSQTGCMSWSSGRPGHAE